VNIDTHFSPQPILSFCQHSFANHVSVNEGYGRLVSVVCISLSSYFSFSVRPKFTETGPIALKQNRHPILEKLDFVPVCGLNHPFAFPFFQ
jgi:hypothetical protein